MSQPSRPGNLNISRVGVIFKTHLDIGFTDYSRNVVRRYMRDYIPGALRSAIDSRNSAHPFVWTTGSFLAYRFLEDASPSNRRLMEKAIAIGAFHWHALPFTTHTELMDENLFRFGLAYSQRLDKRFGRKTVSAKMTDVPGHTIAMVPLLAEAGIRFLHIGVNPASTVPSVPSLFLWRYGQSEIVVNYERVYGATTIFPGGVALSVNLTGDNLGPQSSGEISGVYAELKAKFPNARLESTSLNDAANWVWKSRRQLPVITDEIGDTWIHGVATDPLKVAAFRRLCRLRSEWLDQGLLVAAKGIDRAFGENLLLVAEHTWGMDIKTHLNDWKAYSRRDLSKSLKKKHFRKVAASWQEQRGYLREAVRSLPADLRKQASKELFSLKARRPLLSRWKRVDSLGGVSIGPWSLVFSPDGSIERLCREGSRQILADESHPLGVFSYQTFSPGDYQRFYRSYNTTDEEWVKKDFTKFGLSASSVSAWHYPTVKASYVHKIESSALVLLEFSKRAHDYGAPKDACVQLTAVENGLEIALSWFEKPSTRMPEALWLAFSPRLLKKSHWTFEKLGSQIDPTRVVHNGSRHLHAVSGLVRAEDFTFHSLDAPLIVPGKPSLLDFNNKRPELKKGIVVNLFNNIWGTNFPMWSIENKSLFRFRLNWKL